MPSFFDFQQGNEGRGPTNDSSPLLGRFRAVPDAPRRSHRNSVGLLGGFPFARSLERGYGSVFGSLGGEDGSDDDVDGEDIGAMRRWGRTQRDLWLEPKQAAVARIVNRWWSRWAVLVILPAALVSCGLIPEVKHGEKGEHLLIRRMGIQAVAWCALPFPQYDLPDDDDVDGLAFSPDPLGHKIPGHGEARVEINFWFFLFVYYGFYNITALMWITKVFNIYSLNWYVFLVLQLSYHILTPQ
jgi:hypothetical protein